jgi:signal transduction histidine kinase
MADLAGHPSDPTVEVCRMDRQEGLACETLKSIAAFSSSIAHTYNNLLMAIMGNISMAQLHLENDSHACLLLKEAYKASMQAKDLTRKLITLSKMGSQALSVLPKTLWK